MALTNIYIKNAPTKDKPYKCPLSGCKKSFYRRHQVGYHLKTRCHNKDALQVKQLMDEAFPLRRGKIPAIKNLSAINKSAQEPTWA